MVTEGNYNAWLWPWSKQVRTPVMLSRSFSNPKKLSQGYKIIGSTLPHSPSMGLILSLLFFWKDDFSIK